MPTPPQHFGLARVPGSPSMLLASWTTPDPANGIIIGYRVNCHADPFGSITLNSSASFAVLGNLKPYTQYRCSVQAFTGVGLGSASEQQVARTGQDCKFQ